jgi:toxin-antitoxin system PIN domain toxin
MPKSMASSAGESKSDPSGWLSDVNVWLALCSDRHEHHHAANDWLAGVREPVYFCRAAQMALLRLLTNPRVMDEDLRTPGEAIAICQELRADERVRFAHEPPGAESLWFSLMAIPVANGSVWTDAWLAAFA